MKKILFINKLEKYEEKKNYIHLDYLKDKINDYEPEYIYDITSEIKDNDGSIHGSEFCFSDDNDDDDDEDIDIQKIFQIQIY